MCVKKAIQTYRAYCLIMAVVFLQRMLQPCKHAPLQVRTEGAVGSKRGVQIA